MAEKVNSRRYLICPCVAPGQPNACMDKYCLEANECLDLKYGGQDVAKYVAENKANVAAPEQPAAPHICPHDDQNCQLISCDGGRSCVAKKKGTGTALVPYGGHTTHYVSKDCHVGMNSIGKIGGAEIFCGKEAAAKHWDEYSDGKIGLIIGLLGDPYPQGPMIGVNNQAAALKGMTGDLIYMKPQIPNIWIRWPDYGVVPFDRTWWKRLMGLLDNVDGAVLIYCMGGHGRTGTCAAIIATLGGLVPEGECPVEWLRSVYCEKVVESDAQLKYIEHITGRPVKAEGSKGWTYIGSSSGSSSYGSHQRVADEKKKDHGGEGYAQGKTSGRSKARSEPQKLSIKKWKQWWRRQAKTTLYPHIINVTRPKDLPNGQVFQIGKRQWKWQSDEHTFLEVKKPKKARKDVTERQDV